MNVANVMIGIFNKLYRLTVYEVFGDGREASRSSTRTSIMKQRYDVEGTCLRDCWLAPREAALDDYVTTIFPQHLNNEMQVQEDPVVEVNLNDYLPQIESPNAQQMWNNRVEAGRDFSDSM